LEQPETVLRAEQLLTLLDALVSSPSAGDRKFPPDFSPN
jgi:hypothetical protein